MCPDHQQPTIRPRPRAVSSQRGFSIVSAIFLLVILAGLSAVMLNFGAVQHTTSQQDVQGSRAYQAARIGIEWGAYRVMNPENTNPAIVPHTTQFDCPVAPAAPQVATLSNLGGVLSGFVVSVACSKSANDYVEGSNVVRIFTITATATMASGPVGDASYVERQLTATIPTCRVGVANGPPC
jgi:MSHA biogenesis protein MshP